MSIKLNIYKWLVQKILHGFGTFLISCILCLLFVDAAIRVFDLDIAAAIKTAYVFSGYEGLYRQSENTERLYELVPGYEVTSTCRRRADDVDLSDVVFSINRFGFRSDGGPEPFKKKPEGVFRIVAVGGSNTFGFAVNGNQTWPAQLEKVLNEKMPGRFEVLNAGLSSYNMSQKTAYAKQIIKDFDPDLLVFQHFNCGRKAFLANTDFAYFFRRNKKLWYENIPLIRCYVSDNLVWHKFLVSNWALYRVVVASYNYYLSLNAGDLRHSSDVEQLNFLMRKYLHLYFSVFADKLVRQEVHDFIEQVNKDGAVRLALIDNTHNDPETCFIKELPLLSIKAEAEKDNKHEYYWAIHPPSQVYEWYGSKIADWLINEGLIPEEKA